MFSFGGSVVKGSQYVILLLVAASPERKSSYLLQYEPNADFPL